MSRQSKTGTQLWLLPAFLAVCVGCGKQSQTKVQEPSQSATESQQDRGDTPAAKDSAKAGADEQPAAKREPEEETLGKHQLLHKTGAVNRPLTSTLPRKLVYTSLRFTVTKGTISDQAPPSKKRRADADHIYAYLNVSIHNEAESTTFYGISPNVIKLRFGEDEYGSPQTEDWSLELKPKATEKVTLVFAVPKDATWKHAEMVVSQGGEEPAILALEGSLPATAYPMALALPKQTEAKAGNFVCKLTSAALDVEHKRKRVAKGHRFLKLTGTLTYQGTTVVANFFGDREFRVLADGKVAEPVSQPIESLSPKSPRPFEAIYKVPAETKAVEFRMGEKEDAAVKIVVDVKAAKP